MRVLARLTIAALLVVSGLFPASAAPRDPAALRPMSEFVRAVNAGETITPSRFFTSDAVICDEVPPYRWLGQKAIANWLRDDGRLIAAHHIEHAVISVGTPTFFHRSGNDAYAIYPLVDAYVVRGKRQRETGLLSAALVDTSAGWRIKLACFAKQSDTSDASWDGQS